MKYVFIVMRDPGIIEGCYTTSDGAWEKLNTIGKAFIGTPYTIVENRLHVMVDGAWVVAAYYVRYPIRTSGNND